MKKSTILIILIVFVGSVLIVGIFGMQNVPYEQIKYVKDIVPTSVTTMSGNNQGLVIKTDQNGYYVALYYEEGLELLISYDLKPADCTNKNVKVAIVYPVQNQPAVITERNTILFSRKGSIHLQYRATDSVAAPVMDFWIYAL